MAPRVEQLKFILDARIGVSGFAAAGGTSDTVTTALGQVLATASRSGGSMPLQVGSDTQEGVEVASGRNVVPIYTAAGTRLTDATGADVYGKLTNAGSVWTLSYFSSPGGTEAAFTMPAGPIGWEFDYGFDLRNLPRNAISGVTDRRLNPDPQTLGTRLYQEALTVTATNTLSGLTYAAAGATALLIVNQMAYRGSGAAPPFWVSGKVATWSQANAGFALQPGDDVLVVYSY